jgi:GNAT superfamily N-acetyltransferase
MNIVARELTEAEQERRSLAAEELAREFGNPMQEVDRYGIVAMDKETLAGCATGAVYKNGDQLNGWACLEAMYLEKPYRRLGLGSLLLRLWEQRIASIGVKQIWSETAGYEAPEFYKKQGYTICYELENSYPSGHPQVGVRKILTQTGRRQIVIPALPIPLKIVDRTVTDAEIERIGAGFVENALLFGNPPKTTEPISFIAEVDGNYAGCVTGLVYKENDVCNPWFVLTDLFLEKSYRKQGLGARLLNEIETLAVSRGCRYVKVRMAGYGNVYFFRKHGYDVYCEYEHWYTSGHGMMNLQKTLVKQQ